MTFVAIGALWANTNECEEGSGFVVECKTFVEGFPVQDSSKAKCCVLKQDALSSA